MSLVFISFKLLTQLMEIFDLFGEYSVIVLGLYCVVSLFTQIDDGTNTLAVLNP